MCRRAEQTGDGLFTWVGVGPCPRPPDPARPASPRVWPSRPCPGRLGPSAIRFRSGRRGGSLAPRRGGPRRAVCSAGSPFVTSPLAPCCPRQIGPRGRDSAATRPRECLWCPRRVECAQCVEARGERYTGIDFSFHLGAGRGLPASSRLVPNKPNLKRTASRGVGASPALSRNLSAAPRRRGQGCRHWLSPRYRSMSLACQYVSAAEPAEPSRLAVPSTFPMDELGLVSSSWLAVAGFCCGPPFAFAGCAGCALPWL